jgi:hypothetical protein
MKRRRDNLNDLLKTIEGKDEALETFNSLDKDTKNMMIEMAIAEVKKLRLGKKKSK